jgi:hypothetical protein
MTLTTSQRRFIQAHLDRRQAIIEALRRSKHFPQITMFTLSGEGIEIGIDLDIARLALRTQQSDIELKLKHMGIDDYSIDTT